MTASAGTQVHFDVTFPERLSRWHLLLQELLGILLCRDTPMSGYPTSQSGKRYARLSMSMLGPGRVMPPSNSQSTLIP